MHCTILALGSRGDVQPMLALALGLKAHGHAVRVAAPADFAEWITGLGLDFFRLTGKSASFFSGPAGTAVRDRVRDPRQFQRFFDDYLATFLDKLLAACWEACQDTDAIFSWSWTRGAPSLAEKLRVPVFVASPTPVLHLPTFAFANPFQGPGDLPLGPLSPLYNRWSWRWALPGTRVGQDRLNAWRTRSLGLEPCAWRDDLAALRRLPHLLGFSPTVLPKPRDWGPSVHVTGFWFMDQTRDYTPPADLAAFLTRGDKPVAVGFSSQVGKDARRVTQAVVDGLTRAGRRGILVAGWGGLKGVDLPDSILCVDQVPYDWLAPHVAALVHHGGAGSTAMALRAGLPNFAVPFGYDQALWGRGLARLGVGVPPIPAERLTADTLARAVDHMCDDPSVRHRAGRVQAAIAAEDGVQAAIAAIDRILATHPRRAASSRLRPALAQGTP